MPELPEVETIKNQLQRKFAGRRIEEVRIKDARVIKGISAAAFKSRLNQATVENIFRRGKVLIAGLSGNFFLVMHLRINGWMVISGKEEVFSKVVFKLSDGMLFNFCDDRVLAEIRLTDNWREMPIIKTMGPEPLELGKNDFIRLFLGRKVKIKPLLMDQKFIAGVGNLYAQESLFCAGLNPALPANTIKEDKLGELYNCLTGILKDSISKKGSSIDTYRQLDGEGGGYASFLKVYQRAGEACFRCKGMIKREIIGGRGTYFCPNCQR